MNKMLRISRLLSIAAAFVVFAVAPSFAQAPDAPVVLKAASGACVAAAEVCGDNIDQDCNGDDLPCATPDKDRDGFAGAADCDDNNRNVYPGIAVACSASTGSGTKTCQSSGSFTACSAAPLCEATGSGKCYYISRLTGNDSNPGTFAAPWQSFKKIVTYAGTRPAGWVQLAPGDVVYFMSGLYDDTYSYSGTTKAIYFNSVNGTASNPITLKAYPGALVTIAPAQRAPGIVLDSSSYFVIDGFEVTGAYEWGVRLGGGHHHEIRNCRIHDNDGTINNNISGFSTANASYVRLHHSMLHDTYVHASTRDANSRDIVLFDGGYIRIDHNVIFHSNPIGSPHGAGCMTFKHAATIPNSTFEVDHNIFWACDFQGVGTGTYNTRIHHNLMLNSQPFEVMNFGGTTHHQNIVIDYNTVINGGGLAYNPDNQYSTIGSVAFRNNIVVDNRTNTSEASVVRVHSYGSDALYNAVVPKGLLQLSNNCYHGTKGALMWNLFGSTNGGALGGFYSFTQWRSLGFDAGSVVADPQLNNAYIPQNSACANMGWNAGW